MHCWHLLRAIGLLVVVIAVGPLLSASCSDGGERAVTPVPSEPVVSTEGAQTPGPTTSSGSTPTSPTTVGAPLVPGEYVALGDSYSSGEGAPSDVEPGWVAGTNVFRVRPRRIGSSIVPVPVRLNGCHRSRLSWARTLGVSPVNHLACSGAIVPDVIAGGQEMRPPDDRSQLERLRDLSAASPVSLITITLGGNDARFGDIVRSCRLGPGDCLADLKGTELPLFEAVGRDLENTYTQIQGAAPGARLLVVGYPDIFPLPRAGWTRCGWMTDSEKERVETFTRLLEGTIRDAADRAGVEFLPTRDVLAGHELCTADSWVFPITSAQSGPLDQMQAHPTRSGQEAIASAVRAYLTAHPAKPAPGSDVTSDGPRDLTFPMVSDLGYAFDVGLRIGPPVVTTSFGDPGYLAFTHEPAWVGLSVSNATPDREAPITGRDGGELSFWIKAWYDLPLQLTSDLSNGDVPFAPPSFHAPPTVLYVQTLLGPEEPYQQLLLPVGGVAALRELTGRIRTATYGSETLGPAWEALFARGPSYYTIEAQTSGFGNEGGLFRCSSGVGDIDGLWGLVALVAADGTLVTSDDCATFQSLEHRRGQ